MWPRRSVVREVLTCALIVTFMMTKTAFAQSRAEEEFFLPADVEFFALHQYPTYKLHKALAVGPGGWAVHIDSPSADAAASAALEECNRAIRAYVHAIPNSKCVLFDVDGKQTGEIRVNGEAIGTAARGEDHPWQAGKEWATTATTGRGTMLMVHGCNRVPEINGTVMAWVSYYRAIGFRVIMPDSFADMRDPETCGLQRDVAALNRQGRNVKLRISQTLRTIAGVRRKYPGEPLYLHGHSEGGWVVQALGQSVSGIIVTGTSCGFGQSAFYLAGKNVPLLVVAGTRDKSFPAAASAETLSNYCRDVSGIGKMTWVSIPEMGHNAAPWRPEVMDAISKFLDAPQLTATRRPATGVRYPTIPADEHERYRKSGLHKAIAAHKLGGWYWAGDYDDKLDAEEDVLYACDQLSQKSPFADRFHQHECNLVDVDDERLVK